MTVYVDDMEAGFGRMIMCHMIADTEAELVSMAEAIGVAAKWIQHPGTARVHFDIAKSKRSYAVAFGAVEITRRQYAGMVFQREHGVPWTTPEDGQEFLRDIIAKRRSLRPS